MAFISHSMGFEALFYSNSILTGAYTDQNGTGLIWTYNIHTYRNDNNVVFRYFQFPPLARQTDTNCSTLGTLESLVFTRPLFESQYLS